MNRLRRSPRLSWQQCLRRSPRSSLATWSKGCLILLDACSVCASDPCVAELGKVALAGPTNDAASVRAASEIVKVAKIMHQRTKTTAVLCEALFVHLFLS